MNESEFDNSVMYTLRIELSNGKALLYTIDTENKQYLLNKLRINSDGAYEGEPLPFLWFETTYNRQVIVNTDSIARIGFDAAAADPEMYRDNFNVAQANEEYLPQAIVYHKGKAVDDQSNPLLYSSLDGGCLADFDLELDGEQTLRQFVNLLDEEGEETFIPLSQIMVMEFDQDLLYAEEEIEDDEEDE
jgi:hypothetical protein